MGLLTVGTRAVSESFTDFWETFHTGSPRPAFIHGDAQSSCRFYWYLWETALSWMEMEEEGTGGGRIGNGGEKLGGEAGVRGGCSWGVNT